MGDIHNHCVLSKRALEWLNGELLGDGCLMAMTKYSARFQYSSKHLEYIEYVAKTLNGFGIEQVGKIRKYVNEWGAFYQYCSRTYIELSPLRRKWYPEPLYQKIVPKDTALTSLTCRQWYIGDGCLHHIVGRRPFIILHTNSFPIDDVEWLANELGVIGIVAIRRPSDNIIRIAACSTADFLYHTGDCPVECYKYKWDY